MKDWFEMARTTAQEELREEYNNNSGAEVTQVCIQNLKSIGSYSVEFEYGGVKSGALSLGLGNNNIVNLIMVCNGCPALWRCVVVKRVHSNMPNISWGEDLSLKGEFFFDFELIFELNIKEFERLSAAKQTIQGMRMIADAVQKDNQEIYNKEKYKLERKPKRVPKHPYKQPAGFKGALQKFSLDAIAWMKSIEDNSNIVQKQCYLNQWRAAQCQRLFSPSKFDDTFALEQKSDYTMSYTTCGGVLANETCIGRDEIIGLMLVNVKTQKNEQKEVDPNKQLFSGGNLILCPNDSVEQWKREIKEKTDGRQSVLSITSANDLANLSYNNIEKYDIVIFPYEMFKEPKHFFMVWENKKNISIDDTNKRPSSVATRLAALRGARNPGEVKNPIIDHFFWHRIIIDEVHYIMSPEYKNTILQLKCTFKWIFTENPFQYPPYMSLIAGWLVNTIAISHESYNTKLVDDTKVRVMVDNLFWRNTKESIKDEMYIPSFVEDLVLLDLIEEEQKMYDAAPDHEKSNLANSVKPNNGPMLSDFTFFNWPETANTNNKEENVVEQKEIVQEREEIVEKVGEIVQETEEEPTSKYTAEEVNKMTVAQLSTILKKAKVDIPLKSRKQALQDLLLSSNVSKTENSEVKEDRKRRSKRIASALEGEEERKTKIRKAEELPVDKSMDLNAKQPEREVISLNYLVQTFGTKLGNLFLYLQKIWNENPQAHVTIFSSFKPLLQKVSLILAQHNVGSTFISEYREKSNDAQVKVFLVDLTENVTATTNNQLSNYLIFIDQGEKQDTISTETKLAIKERNITVTQVKFIAKNTIEYDAYLKYCFNYL